MVTQITQENANSFAVSFSVPLFVFTEFDRGYTLHLVCLFIHTISFIHSLLNQCVKCDVYFFLLLRKGW